MKQALLSLLLLISIAGYSQTTKTPGQFTQKNAAFADTLIDQNGTTQATTLQKVFDLFGVANKLNITDTTAKWVTGISKNTAGDSIIYFVGGVRYAIKDNSGTGGTTLTNNLTTNSSGTALDAQQGYILKGLIDGNTGAIAGKQGALTLTTTGNTGAASLIGNTLNIPQYSGGGGTSGIPVADKANISLGDSTLADPNLTQKTWEAYGNSVTYGTTTTNSTPRSEGYVQQLSRAFGTIMNNYGVSGTTIADFFTRVKPYTSTMKYVSLMYGINDARWGTGVGEDTASYRAMYNRALDTLITLGYPSGIIIVLGSTYATPTGNIPLSYYAAIDSQVAVQHGVKFVENYNYMLANGGASLLADVFHPTVAGHTLVYKHIVSVLNNPAETQGNGYVRNNMYVGGRLSADFLSSRNGALQTGTNAYTYLGDSLRWGNPSTITGNRILIHDKGTFDTRSGMGYNSNTGTVIFSENGVTNGKKLLFGVGNDAYTMTTANSAMYIDASNFVRIKAIRDSLTWGNSSVTNNRILLFDNGTTNTRTGFGINTTNTMNALFSRDTYFLGLANGIDASTLSTSTVAMYVDLSNRVVINKMFNPLTWGSTTVSENRLLLFDNGSSSTRIGFGVNYTGTQAVIHSRATFPLLFSVGQDALTSTTTNAAMYINTSNQLNLNKKLLFAATNTATGTTGAQTINNPDGSVNFAAGTTSLTVTNSQVTATSHIDCVIEALDANKPAITAVVPAAGSFTIYLTTAPAAELKVGFLVRD